jgi:hypothetical protein
MYADPTKPDYAVGGTLSYADLFIFEMVSIYFPRDRNFKQLASRFPRIFRIHANVEKDKLVSSYIKSRDQQSLHIPSERI